MIEPSGLVLERSFPGSLLAFARKLANACRACLSDQALEREKQRLEMAASAASLGVWSWTPATGALEWDALVVLASAAPVALVSETHVQAPVTSCVMRSPTRGTEVWPAPKKSTPFAAFGLADVILKRWLSLRSSMKQQTVVAVECQTSVRCADAGRADLAVLEDRAVGAGGRGVGDFEQAALGTGNLIGLAPPFFGRQIRAPRRPARCVTRDEALRTRFDDGDGAHVEVGVPQIDALYATRAGFERHEQVTAGIRASAVGVDHVPVALALCELVGTVGWQSGSG